MNSDKNKKSGSLPSRIRTAALAGDFPYKPLLRALTVCIAAAVIASATVFGVSRPFGIAMIAASSGFGMTAAALAGTLSGAVASPEFTQTAVAAVLLFAARILIGLLIQNGGGGESNGERRLRSKKKHPLPTGPTSRTYKMRSSPGGSGGGGFPENPAKAAVGSARASSPLAAILRSAATESIWLRMAFAATAAMVCGSIGMISGGAYGVGNLAAVFFSALIAPLSTLALCTLTERQLRVTPARDAGILILMFAVTRALRDATGLPFNAGAIFAFAGSVIAAKSPRQKNGVPVSDTRRIMSGTVCGLVCGIAMDPGGAPVYAAAALTAGVLYRFSSAAAICGGWACALAVSFAGGGLVEFAAILPELTVTAAILIPLMQFRVIPDASLRGESKEVVRGAAEEAAAVERGRADFSIARMRSLAASMHAISGVFSSIAEKLRRPSVLELKEMCDAAFEKRCRTCENQSLCWEREYASTSDTVCRMTAELHKNGKVSAAVIPPALASRCHNASDILDEVNEGCARRAQAALKTDRSDVFSQDFEAFSQLLTHAAEDTDNEFAPDEELSRKLQRSLKYMDFYAGNVTVYGGRRRRIMARDLDLTRIRMGGTDIRTAFEKITGAHLRDPEYSLDGGTVSMTLESVPFIQTSSGSATQAAGEISRVSGRTAPNGDCSISFESGDGRYYMLICDGMGTGGEASVTARLAAAFLEETLSGGADMTVALTMLNNYMRSRNMECSAGIDLMEIDRYTGEARFIKSGAAPSFVVRNGRLFRLCSKTVPIGILRALDAEMIRFTLESGDIIVMLSDGVTENFENTAWLCDMLVSPTVMAEEADQIAERIIRAASASPDVERRRDDITAAVVKIA